MSPELRAGNASLRAGGDETLEAVQAAAAVAGQFLPVDADRAMTVRDLLQRRDGGPLEARYGRLRDRVLAAGIGGLSLGSEAVKDVAGYDLRRMLLGNAPVEWAVFRLAQLPERRERLLARGGDAFALAEALRADPAAPAALVVLEPGLLALAEDCGAGEAARRHAHVERCAREAGAAARAARRAGLAEAVHEPARDRRAHGRARRPLRAPRARGRVGLRRRAAAGPGRRRRPPRDRDRAAGTAGAAPSSWRRCSARCARDRDRSHRRAAAALRRARPPVRLVRALPPALPDLRPARGRVGRPARPHPHHAAPGRRRSLGRGRARPARPLSRLPRLRDGLPVGRALRRAARDRARRRGADALAPGPSAALVRQTPAPAGPGACAQAGRWPGSRRAPPAAAARRSMPTRR